MNNIARAEGITGTTGTSTGRHIATILATITVRIVARTNTAGEITVPTAMIGGTPVTDIAIIDANITWDSNRPSLPSRGEGRLAWTLKREKSTWSERGLDRDWSPDAEILPGPPLPYVPLGQQDRCLQ